MNTTKLKEEIINAENTLLTNLREGRLKEGVALHFNSADYKNIWNGEIKTFEILEERIKKGMENGLKAFDYHVRSRDFKFINDDYVMETITAVPHSVMQSGQVIAEGLTTISILWQNTETGWRVGYLHASELKEEN